MTGSAPNEDTACPNCHPAAECKRGPGCACCRARLEADLAAARRDPARPTLRDVPRLPATRELTDDAR